MRVPVVAATVGLLAACVIDSPSFDETYGSGPTTGASAQPTSTGDAGTSSTTTASTTATSSTGATSTTSAAASTATADATTDGDTSDGSTTLGEDTVYPVSSCLELQQLLEGSDQPVVSGIYTITLPQMPNTTVTVYCDLETAGGGWLLVGRSHPSGAAESFGWRSQTGSVYDDNKPYSLGLHVHPFEFGEILIGDYAAGKTWGGNVYNLGLPSDLVGANQNDAESVSFYAVIAGPCMPNQLSWMLRYAGFTSLTSAFFFRDSMTHDGADYGLLHDKLWTFYTDAEFPAQSCPLGGELANKQGMLMIR